MAKENKLKQGQKTFDFLGRVKMDSKGTVTRIDGVSDSGFIYNSIKLMLDTGDGNSVKVESFGGYFPEDHENKSFLYLNDKDWDKDQIKLDFFDRKNDTIMESIEDKLANNNYFRAGMEFGKGDKYPIIKEFLSEYDLIEYINEHLEDGDIVKVKGNIEPNIYNGNVNKTFSIKYIAKRKESELRAKLKEGESIDSLFYANFTETLYFVSDSVGRKDRESGLYPVRAYSLDYISKLDNVEIKSVKAVPTTYWLDSDKMIKYLTPSRKCVNKVTVEGRIVNKSKTKKLTFEELDDDVKELIEDGLLTKEDAIGKATVYGGFESKRYIDTVAIYTQEKDGNVKQTVQKEQDYLDDENKIFDIVLDIDEPEEADLNEEYDGEDEDIIESISSDTEEDKELDDILSGL